jgi:hypothetical protein
MFSGASSDSHRFEAEYVRWMVKWVQFPALAVISRLNFHRSPDHPSRTRLRFCPALAVISRLNFHRNPEARLFQSFSIRYQYVKERLLTSTALRQLHIVNTSISKIFSVLKLFS